MSKLQQHFMKEHDLMLLDSEVHDILELARQEIELPTTEELDEWADMCAINTTTDNTTGPIIKAALFLGGTWALGKVRNPYPKPM
jgi:hypothetical protein